MLQSTESKYMQFSTINSKALYIEKVLHLVLQGLKVIKPEVYLIDSSCTCSQLTAAKMYYRKVTPLMTVVHLK